MITFIVRLRAGAGEEEAVEAELRAVARLVRRDEPGCLAYFVHRSQAEPDLFVVYEQYEDENAVELHRESAHFKAHVIAGVIPRLVERSREDLIPITD